MKPDTPLTARLGILYPIFQAPMAGGTSTPALVAAVAQAGGLGFLGCAYQTAAQIEATVADVRTRTTKPFGINLFAPQPVPTVPSDAADAVARVARFHRDLALPEPAVPAVLPDPFEEQMPAVLASGAAVFSFTFGIPPAVHIAAARERGMLVVGTATTVDEALALERAGVDAIVAQGSEAGAHRGTFGVDFNAAMIGTMALVPQVVDAVHVPVIASGGIMDGRGIAAALVLGASAVQMGTAFLTAHESGAPDAHKDAILRAAEHETRVTRAFSGRPARGIENRFMRDVDPVEGPLRALPYPLQNALTRPLRTAAGKAGQADFLSLWAGQGLRLARREPAAALVARWVEQMEERLRSVAG